jgi:hypothetical protein
MASSYYTDVYQVFTACIVFEKMDLNKKFNAEERVMTIASRSGAKKNLTIENEFKIKQF